MHPLRFLFPALICALLPLSSAFATIKVDLSRYTLRSDTAAPHFTEWQFDPASPSRTFDGVSVTLRRSGSSGSALDTNWYKAAIDVGALLALDCVYVKDATTDAEIVVELSGLAAGHHSFASYHNSVWSSATTLSKCSVYVNGTLKASGIQPSTQVFNDYDCTSAYVEFDTTAGQTVTLTFKPDGSGSMDTAILNGFEIDGVNPAKKAIKPSPAHDDEHANGDSGSLTLSWTAASGSASHDLFFGTDETTVSSATRSSACYLGNKTVTSHTVSNLAEAETYYWRVDEVDSSGVITKGDLWRFRIRHLAFPGAEGYGRFARGGRGGRVIEVTTLLDYDTSAGDAVIPGSYRAAIEATGPRTIVFRVSGLIRLKKPCVIGEDNSYVTIAGQTAPGEGICLANYRAGLGGCNDVIMRFIRLRVGDACQTAMDGIGMGSSTDHSILDHCTISWALDEGTSSRDGRNITFQRNIVSEGLQHSYHYAAADRTKYETHAFAGSISGKIGSFHHNLLAHCTDRNWSLAGGLTQASTYAGYLDIRNNVVYNWTARTTDGGVFRCNYVNNYYKPYTRNPYVTWLLKLDAINSSWGIPKYYMVGNVMEGFSYEANNWTAFNNGSTVEAQVRSDEPLFDSYVTTHTAREAYKLVMCDVGATYPERDVIDKRLVEEVRTGTVHYAGTRGSNWPNNYTQPPPPNYPGIIDTQTDVLDASSSPNAPWPAYATRDVPLDSDHDGMPDSWESAMGLNPNLADNNSKPFGDSYTALEHYLNWLASPHATAAPGTTLSVDLRTYTAGFSSPSFVLSNNLKGNAVLQADGYTVKFAPSAGSSGMGGFSFTARDSDGVSFSDTVNVLIDTSSTVAEVPVSITTAPFSHTVLVGTRVILSVTAEGSAPLSYQWYKEGVAISGATSATYAIASASASDAGQYTVEVRNPGYVSTTLSPATLTVVQSIDAGQLTAISVRSYSGPGDQVIIAGISLSGTGQKRLVLRGLGPIMTKHGVSNVVADPIVSVFSYPAGLKLGENDNWSGDDGHTYGPEALDTGSKDSVLFSNFSEGLCTAMVKGVGDTYGNAMVEIYDTEPSKPLRITGLSARTQLDPGQVLIPGIIISGGTSRTLIVRISGPALSSLGVAKANADPKIKLFSGSNLVMENDDWSGDDGRSIGLSSFATGSKDAVILTTLPPGAYTMHISGNDSIGGIVLLEVYVLN